MKSGTIATLLLSGILAGALPLTSAMGATDSKAPLAKTKSSKSAAGTSWSGALVEVGRSGQFQIVVTLNGKGGQTSYPDQHCTGKLTRAGSSGDYSFFTETISEGKYDAAAKTGCVDGSLTLVKTGSAVVLGWFGTSDGKPIVAYGSLVPQP